jgi:uncharacterized protein YprB with RNaseH-like and TPR domain
MTSRQLSNRWLLQVEEKRQKEEEEVEDVAVEPKCKKKMYEINMEREAEFECDRNIKTKAKKMKKERERRKEHDKCERFVDEGLLKRMFAFTNCFPMSKCARLSLTALRIIIKRK